MLPMPTSLVGWIEVVIVALALIFLVVPGAAAAWAGGLKEAGSTVGNWAKAALGYIGKVFSLEGLKARLERRNADLLEQRIDELESHQPPYSEAELERRKKRTETALTVPEPGAMELADHWALRFVYIVLVLVCFAADFVLVAARVGALIFGETALPDFLVNLFKYLDVITGALFVCMAILSGMLINEYRSGTSDYVKLNPFLSDKAVSTNRWLAIAIFVITFVTAGSLALASGLLQFNGQTFSYILVFILIGATILVFLGAFLAWEGLKDGLQAIAVFLGGTLFALVAGVVSLILHVVSAVFEFFATINQGLVALFSSLVAILTGERVQPPPPDQKAGLSIIGFGDEGSRFAAGVCKEVRAIDGSHVWLAGIYTANPDKEATYRKTLKGSGVVAPNHDVSISANKTGARIENAATFLVNELRKEFITTGNADKPVLWVVNGHDLRHCLGALRTLGDQSSTTQAQGANTPAGDQNAMASGQGQLASESAPSVRLVLVWIVPQNADQNELAELHRLAQQLQDWAAPGGTPDKQCILATVIVIEDNSPLARTLAAPTLQHRVEQRSVAALARTSGDLVPIADRLRNGGHLFATLSCGTVGVEPTVVARSGSGQFDPRTASQQLRLLAQAVFDRGELATANDWMLNPQSATTATHAPGSNAPGSNGRSGIGGAPSQADDWQPTPQQQTPQQQTRTDQQVWTTLQQASFVNAIVPAALHYIKEPFEEQTGGWLRTPYSINTSYCYSVWELRGKRDKGIEIDRDNQQSQLQLWRGEYYLHLTVLRGLARGVRPASLVSKTTAPANQNQASGRRDDARVAADGQQAWQGAYAQQRAYDQQREQGR